MTVPATANRRAWKYRAVPTRFLSPEPGELLGTFLERAHRAGAERVMLLGPAPSTDWLLGDAGPWRPDPRGHYLDTDQLAARYELPRTLPPGPAARIELRRASSWFGDGDYSGATALVAWTLLEELIRSVRGWEDARLLGSPTVTGRDLWRRTIRHDAPFPPLPGDQAELIRRTSPQARIQLAPQAGTLPGFHYLDQRFSYAALTRELPVGPARWERAGDGRTVGVIPYAAARYRVDFRAPAGWPWIGAFMVPKDTDRYHFPLRGTVWADGWEVENAIRHGWSVHVRERLIWQKGRPLDSWTARLVRLRELAQDPAGALAVARPEVAALIGRAIRFLVLYAIGAFHASGRTVTHATRDPAEISARSWAVEKRGALWVWEERVEPSEDARAAMHPEWSAAIWARARTRLLCGPVPGAPQHGAGAWHLDSAEDFIAAWLDALYLAHDPGWPDDGRVGRWRHKGALSGPLPAPTSLPGVQTLRRRAEAAQTLSEPPAAILDREA